MLATTEARNQARQMKHTLQVKSNKASKQVEKMCVGSKAGSKKPVGGKQGR